MDIAGNNIISAKPFSGIRLLQKLRRNKIETARTVLWNLFLIIYVDDFKMSGPEQYQKKVWDAMGKKIDIDPPVLQDRYLGCFHKTDTVKEGGELIGG